MAKNSYLNVRLPDYMKEKLDEEAKKKNISVSDLVRFILAAYYSKE